MSGFAVFSLKFSSLLQFEEDMRLEKRGTSLKKMYFINEVPSDTHLRSVLDEITSESIAPVFKNLFSKL